MNNTTVISPIIENPPLVQEIPLDRIVESKTNPRRVFDELKLRELAANVKDHGVLQPVLVRPHPAGDVGLFELVVGARRYRASKLAEKLSIPARIVNLSDSAALELQIIENLHRADVHELDEAFGYKALMEQNPDLYTVEVIGTKVGKSPAYVLGRLKLIELTPTVQKAFYEGKLTVGHALEIARLQSPIKKELSRSASRTIAVHPPSSKTGERRRLSPFAAFGSGFSGKFTSTFPPLPLTPTTRISFPQRERARLARSALGTTRFSFPISRKVTHAPTRHVFARSETRSCSCG